MKNIFVFGSLNVDLVIRAPYLPRAGETMHGDGFMINPGGKGANQAVACGKLGGNVFMGGCVGEDAFGHMLLRSLRDNRGCADAVRVLPQISSGVAVITVVDGDNRIVLDAGANACADRSDVDNLLSLAKRGDIFLTQLENKTEVIGYALAEAKKKGMFTILNPAPATDEIVPWFPYVDVIVPNETESYLLTGTKDFSAALEMLAKVCPHPVITGAKQGEKYEILFKDGGTRRIPLSYIEGSFHGAGDVFASAFCGCLMRGLALERALALSAQLCYDAILRTQKEVPDRKYGLNYERELFGFLRALEAEARQS